MAAKIYIIMSILLIGIAFAVTKDITSFDNQDNPFNITFTGDGYYFQNQSNIDSASILITNQYYLYNFTHVEGTGGKVHYIDTSGNYVNVTMPSYCTDESDIVIVNVTELAVGTRRLSCYNYTSNQFTQLASYCCAGNIAVQGIYFKGFDNEQFLSFPRYSYINDIILELFDFNNFFYRKKNGYNYFAKTTGGYYMVNHENFYDNDYNTYAYASNSICTNFTINYTKYTNISEITWQVVEESGRFNISVPSVCIDSPIRFMAESCRKTGSDNVTWKCWNGAEWQILRYGNNNSGRLYEDDIYYRENLYMFIDIGNKDGIFIFNISNKTSINNVSSVFKNNINQILEDDCDEGVIDNSNCQIPFWFNLNNNIILQVNLTKANYSYGIDNCSDSFKIPSNATALNITYLDVDGNPATVNSTVEVESLIDWENTQYLTTSHQICIYPAWFNYSANISIKYQGVGYNYFEFSDYLDITPYNLNLYTQPGASNTVTFTAYDGSNELASVLSTMYRKIDGDWETIESKQTDITGKAQFSYVSNVEYKFFFSKSGYENYIFYLDPILFTEYDVPMEKSVGLDTIIDYEKVGIAYYPKIFYENEAHNFTFIIQCPTEELQSYDYMISYPTGTVSNSGTSSAGEELTSSFTIGNADFQDIVKVNYCYTIDGYPEKCFTDIYPVILSNQSTLIGIRNKTYGLGIFERLLTAVLIAIIITGLAAMVGQVVPGMVLSFFVWGFLVYIGFIPIWAVLISIAVGVLLLGLRGGQ